MEESIIRIPQGDVRGKDHGSYLSFYNVPYASDRGRFRTAGEAPEFDGIYDASEPGPVFPQAPGRLAFVMGSTEEEKNQSESAFSVNIWTPSTEGKHAVLFWMHGGAFMTGGGAIPWYKGARLAEAAGIVVVSVNYRLGVLGNLYLPEIADVNLSVKDVYQALRWTHENIGYFGGDPDCITIGGQSAGAWYAVMMMGNPTLKGLYRRAALFSFNGGTAPYLPAEAERMTGILLEKLGVKDPEELLTMDVAKILEAQKIPVKQPERLNIPFLPVIDGETIYPDFIRQSAVVSDPAVEVFCGTVAHESTPFVEPLPGEKEADYLEKVRQNTDIAFGNDTELLLRYLGNAGHNCYRYFFRFESVMPHVHSCHCFDLPFLFRNFKDWEGAPFLQGLDRDRVVWVSRDYSDAVVRFMKNGTPNGGWKPYGGIGGYVREFR